MKKKSVFALAVGIGVALAAGVVVWGTTRTSHHVDPMMLALAGMLCLAVGLIAAVLFHLMYDRPAASPLYVPTRLTEDPVAHFVLPLFEPGVIPILARPGLPVGRMLMRHARVFENPDANRDKKILLTIQKGKPSTKSGDVSLNPVVLRDLFDKLKPFDRSEHVLLVDDRFRFAGYIPWAAAMKDFTGDNAETKIRNAIINVLADPSDKKAAKALRGMGGMAEDDTISDKLTIRDAAKQTWGTPMGEKAADDEAVNGLIIYKGKDITKPVGVLTKKGLLQLVATGA
ncbi:MAG: hypothetical protein JOZ72_15270 [Alphaproteobacteria bacterium]|nr:hypothetical protein [Alphaproteobacteria bacterium]